MSKEYTQALDDLFGLVAFQGSFTKAQKYFDIIEEALNRLEAIDNANPREAMEELKQDIKGRVILAEDRQLKLCAVIEQDLLKAQEMKKVLKIIFEKNVDIWLLKSCLTVEQYNFGITQMDNCSVFNLTQEEFNLMKRCE